ncbi:MAG: hypothetical protein FWD11_04495 [Micrococcales bacterium]|nr:hypothetical protein [Micrococcales bacterium]
MIGRTGLMRHAVVVCGLLVWCLIPASPSNAAPSGAVPSAVPVAQAAPIRPDQFYMGVASHLGDHKPRLSDGKLDGEIALTTFGATSLRDEAGWDMMDYSGWADDIKLIPRNGGKVMMLLSYGNPRYQEGGPFPKTPGERKAFLEYARALVAKVGPSNLAGVEVWNEWDVYMGWGGGLEWGDPCPVDPSDASGCPNLYAQLVESLIHPEREGLGVPSLRQAAPGVPIVVNAIAARNPPWTKAVMSRLKARNVQVDGAVLHAYVHSGNGCPGSKRNPPAGAQVAASCMRLVADEVAAAYGQRIPIYVTEVGWSSFDGTGGVSEDVQARNLVETYVRGRATGDTAGIWWYDLVEDRNNDPEEAHFGLIQRDPSDPVRPGRTKPAGHAFTALAHFWAGCTSVDGAYKDNRVFELPCPEGDRRIVLGATLEELQATMAEGAILVDLLGQKPDIEVAGDVSGLVGHPVGVIPVLPPEIGEAAVLEPAGSDSSMGAPKSGAGPPTHGVLGRYWLPATIGAAAALVAGLTGVLLWWRHRNRPARRGAHRRE